MPERERKAGRAAAGVGISRTPRVLLAVAGILLLITSVVAVFVTKVGDGVLVALVVVAGVALLVGIVGVLPSSFAIGGNEVRFSTSEIKSIENVLRDNEVSDADIVKIMTILEKADPSNEAVDAALADATTSSSFEDKILARIAELPSTSVEKNVTVLLGQHGGKGRPPILQGVVTLPDSSHRILQMLTSASETQINRAKSRVQRARLSPDYADALAYFVTPSEAVAGVIGDLVEKRWLKENRVSIVSEQSLLDLLTTEAMRATRR